MSDAGAQAWLRTPGARQVKEIGSCRSCLRYQGGERGLHARLAVRPNVRCRSCAASFIPPSQINVICRVSRQEAFFSTVLVSYTTLTANAGIFCPSQSAVNRALFPTYTSTQPIVSSAAELSLLDGCSRDSRYIGSFFRPLRKLHVCLGAVGSKYGTPCFGTHTLDHHVEGRGTAERLAPQCLAALLHDSLLD